MKLCYICKVEMPEEQFYKLNNNSIADKRYECKKCFKDLINKRNKDRYVLDAAERIKINKKIEDSLFIISNEISKLEKIKYQRHKLLELKNILSTIQLGPLDKIQL